MEDFRRARHAEAPLGSPGHDGERSHSAKRFQGSMYSDIEWTKKTVKRFVSVILHSLPNVPKILPEDLGRYSDLDQKKKVFCARLSTSWFKGEGRRRNDAVIYRGRASCIQRNVSFIQKT